MSPIQPQVSLVATSRNDDHGGSMLYRMQHFIDGYVHQFNKFQVPSELIIVDWNPPADRPPLAEALKIPQTLGCCIIRFVTFSADLHNALPHGAALPLFQMIAKNVGIRRAHGRLVAATNIDILFSDAVMRELKKPLESGFFYRLDRYDAPHELPPTQDYKTILDFCQRESFRRNLLDGTYLKTGKQWLLIQPIGKIVIAHDKIIPDYSLDYFQHIFRMHFAEWKSGILQIGGELWQRFRTVRPPQVARQSVRLSDYYFLLTFKFWNKQFGQPRIFFKKIINMIVTEIEKGVRGLFGCIQAGFSELPQNINHLAVNFGQGKKQIQKFIRVCVKLIGFLMQRAMAMFRKDSLSLRLHTNACGDFTMLTREDWFHLRGYPEWPIFSWNLDSILLYQAFFNNLKQRILPDAPVYHIEHGKGSGYTPDGAEVLFRRIEAKGIPYMDWPGFLNEIKNMHQQASRGDAIIYNPDNWGYADNTLGEIVFADNR